LKQRTGRRVSEPWRPSDAWASSGYCFSLTAGCPNALARCCGAQALTLAAILLGTIGGFGSLFSLLVSPDIRSYNRIFPFISFFAPAGVALSLDATRLRGWHRTLAWGFVLVVGLVDQAPAAQRMNDNYSGISADLSQLRTFVGNLERQLPDGAMVFQLPHRTYLNDEGIGRMKPYDHFRPYLVSRSGRLRADGFAAILVDRDGYPDGGSNVIDAIQSTLSGKGLIAQTDRYVVFDVRSAPADDVRAPSTPRVMVVTDRLTRCEGPPLMNLERVGDTQAPFAPLPIRIPSGQPFRLVGWAVDHEMKVPAGGVEILIDQRLLPAVYGIDRPDVVQYFKHAAYGRSGFTADVGEPAVETGPHTLVMRVLSADRSCYYQSDGLPLVAR
jgi:hypothetical protein